MAGRQDVVGTQSRRSGPGNLVVKHPSCYDYFACRAYGSHGLQKTKKKNMKRAK